MIRNNIAELRAKAHLSQTQLAKRIGTTINMIGKLERGQRTLDTDWLERIAKALGVQPFELIGPVDPKQIVAPKQETLHIALPVALPNEAALTELFVGLLHMIGVDPHEDERARTLAREFPSSFAAIALLQAGVDLGSKKTRATRPHVADVVQPSKPQ